MLATGWEKSITNESVPVTLIEEISDMDWSHTPGCGLVRLRSNPALTAAASRGVPLE